MFAVQYRWRVKPGTEDAFRAAWRAMTESIRERHGTSGSRLHRTDAGELVAYAVWPSRQQWEAAGQQPSANPAAGDAMRACIQQSLGATPLDVVDDLLG